jgi:diguanylate cyclase (GGDEF)-like protein
VAAHEKAIEHLLHLSSLAERGSRADAIARALNAVTLLLDAEAAVLVLASSQRRGERLVLYAGTETPGSLPITLKESAALKAIGERRHAIAVADLSIDAGLAAADSCPGVDSGPVLFAPVDQRDPLPAYIAAYRKRGRAKFTAVETELMLLLAAWLSVTLENIRLAAGTERLAITDDVTEIYNARYLKSALKREVRRANRFGQELSLLLVELDDPAPSGEAPGAARGPRVLKDVAALLAAQVRSFDVLGRQGDDSFMIVLPQTNQGAAKEVAERMRAAVEAATFTPSEVGRVTVTIAVSTFPQDGVELDALFSVAERSLEQGRLRGGNCVAPGARRVA